MNAKYNVTGKNRKALVAAIENITGKKAVYRGIPTFEYEVEDFIIDRSGTLICENEESMKHLMKDLSAKGYTPEGYEGNTASDESTGESSGLTIEIPFEKVNVGNLTKLLEAKGSLIRKAMGVNDLRIIVKEDRVAFPWFSETDAHHAAAYTDFIAALCRMSKKAKRVTATEKEVENEKYAFRCFLLRLGFIGDRYKKDRKILLENLTGSTAFRNGGASHEISE